MAAAEAAGMTAPVSTEMLASSAMLCVTWSADKALPPHSVLMSLAVKWSAVLKPTLAKRTGTKSTGPAMINKAGPAIVLMVFKSSCSQAFWRAFWQAGELNTSAWWLRSATAVDEWLAQPCKTRSPISSNGRLETMEANIAEVQAVCVMSGMAFTRRHMAQLKPMDSKCLQAAQ